ncbi:hypothetical protein ACHWQZ_G005912 [Mnemiopsis leidyi]
MIGRKECSKDLSVLSKIKSLKLDDVYEIPNVFQTIARTNESSFSEWKFIISHPFTPTYIRLNLPAYIQAVRAMVERYCKDETFVKETLQYLHSRIIYEKNRKRVYIAVVENILPYLVENHNNGDVRAILDDIVLSREALSLLEAYLTAKMSNYTNVLVKNAKCLNLVQTSKLFEILCAGAKSKKSNKMLLRWYTEVCGSDVDKNVALLAIIQNYRIYQIEEDKEQGYEISSHLSTLLSSLPEEEYCRAAAAVLPLNYSIVVLDYALLRCDDVLLGHLVDTYHKIGKVVVLFQEILLRYNPRISLGEEFRSKLAEVGSKLPEQQLLTLLELLTAALADNCTDTCTDKPSCHTNTPAHVGSDNLTVLRDGSHDSLPKRQRVCDEKMCGFVADCTSVLLCNCRVKIPSDVIHKIHGITMSLPASSGKSLQLYFNSAVIFDQIPSIHPFNVEALTPFSEEEIKLLIKSLHYSDNPTEKVTLILSAISSYPDVILSEFVFMFNHMTAEHMTTVAELLVSSPAKYSWFIESEVFSRCNDLHSVIINHVSQEFIGTEKQSPLDPLTDLTLNLVREIIKSELCSTDSYANIQNVQSKLYLLSQLSFNSSYLKLVVTTWQLLRQDYLCRDKNVSRENDSKVGVTAFLGRFCRPPPPLTPLPAVFGKHSGQILSEILSYDKSGFSEFVEMYLSVGVSMSSVDLGDLIKYLGERSLEQHSNIVGVLVKELCTNKVAASRYHQDLMFLWKSISGILVGTDNSVKQMPDKVAQCELLCGVFNLATLLLHDVKALVSSEELQSSCFAIALSLLRTSSLGFKYKINLTQNLLDNLENQVINFTEILLNENDGLYLLNESEIDLKTTNKVFIETLISSLPNKNAEFLLHHTKFEPNLVEAISCETVPVSLIPKFINKLSKVQVMNTLKVGCKDAQLLSKCLLCLVHHNYPVHLFNTIYNSILKLIANESYIHAPQTISNIVRASELLSKQKDVARHHVPYILCNIFEYVSKSNPVLVKDITPAVYPLFDVCLVQGLQYLQARLSQPARQLFLQLQSHYKQNIKYQGKT